MKSRKEDMSLAPKGKGRKAAKALYKEDVIVEKIIALSHEELGFETQLELVEYAISYYEGIAGGVVEAAALGELYRIR